MTPKIGIIKTSSFNILDYPEVIRDAFEDIELLGITHKKLFAFEDYINGYPFDYVFDTEEEFQTWINNEQYPPLYKYFLIPLDLVPQIGHYSGFVKQTFPELIFDVILESQTIPVEGIDVVVPSNQVKLIPCNCTHWSVEGLQLLDAVIQNWNTAVPNKTINFPVKFESFVLFTQFRDSNINQH